MDDLFQDQEEAAIQEAYARLDGYRAGWYQVLDLRAVPREARPNRFFWWDGTGSGDGQDMIFPARLINTTDARRLFNWECINPCIDVRGVPAVMNASRFLSDRRNVVPIELVDQVGRRISSKKNGELF